MMTRRLLGPACLVWLCVIAFAARGFQSSETDREAASRRVVIIGLTHHGMSARGEATQEKPPANLVVAHKQGREKLHYLNAVPINEIAERWIGNFEERRLHALSNLKRQTEED